LKGEDVRAGTDKVRALVTTSLFAALAVVVSKLKVPLPVPHMKIEGSLAVSLFLASSFGNFKYGWYVEIIKYILNLTSSHTFGLGETVDLLTGLLAVWSFVFLRRRFRLPSKKSFHFVFVLEQIVFTLLGNFVINLVAWPVYFWLFNLKFTARMLLGCVLAGEICSAAKVGLACVVAAFLQGKLPRSLQKIFY
jgi:riboflavin transporter FmnP